jgi:hypothetical protein
MAFVEAHGGEDYVNEGVGWGAAVFFEFLPLVYDRFSVQSCANSHDCTEMVL